MYALQRLLYGPLRPIEMEQLSEKAWYAVLDTLLAMPTYREDVGGWLLTMFVLLLAGKVWGWIGEGRVDILEQQPPANPRLFHARLASSLTVSVLFDIWMLQFCVESVIADPRPGIMVIFTFEFAILNVCSLFTLSRYLLSLYEVGVVQKQTRLAIAEREGEIRIERANAAATAMNRARDEGRSEAEIQEAGTVDNEPIDVDENEVSVPGWEEKRRYLFGLELLTDFIKLTIYITFFVISVAFNGLPMHILRDVYMTFASFSKRVADFIAYRKATSEMNTRYPDATTEEIREDSCIICRENMVAWQQTNDQAVPQADGVPPAPVPAPTQPRDEGLRAKKLPCGHILHLRCLKAWLERQQVCPTCRRPVVAAVPPAATTADAGNAQPGQAGQAGQPGPPGQLPAPRPARGRMFNLGPLRVALLNAPNEQMRNILNEIENPGGAVNQNAHAGADTQGLNGASASGPAHQIHRRAAVPINIQLMQVEQRLMQEAYNLGIDQQQLAHLRTMEAELARLRAQRISVQPPVGVSGPPRMMPPRYQPHYEQLAGSLAQVYGAGHENLPEGVTIPEGWSVMPLRRADAIQDANAQPTTPQPETVAEPGPVNNEIGNAQHSDIVADGFTVPSNVSPAVDNTTATGTDGPTDEQGSPLFIATDATLNAASSSASAATTAAITAQSLDNASTSRSTPATQAELLLSSSSPPGPRSQVQDENRAPWATDNSGWGFDDQLDGSSESAAPAATQPDEESPNGQNAPKEVQVEEVPDAGT